MIRDDEDGLTLSHRSQSKLSITLYYSACILGYGAGMGTVRQHQR
jgi:hypothetical protein